MIRRAHRNLARCCVAAFVLSVLLPICERAYGSPSRAPNDLKLSGDVPASIAQASTDRGAVTSASPVWRAFEDFVVGCDNMRECVAVGVPADREEGIALVVHRDADGASVSLVAIDSLATVAPTLDGRPLRTEGRWAEREGQSGLRFEGDVGELIEELSNGQSLSQGRRSSHRVSLHGLKATLLFIDERQGRIDTTSAWVAKGSKTMAEPVAPSAPMLPSVATPELQEGVADTLSAYARKMGTGLLNRAASEAGLDTCDQPTGDSGGDLVFPLDGKSALVALQCIGGAYQTSFVTVKIDRAMKMPPELVELPGPPGIDWPQGAARSVITDPDLKNGVLTSMTKGRGLGDCGELSQWRYDGMNFQLAWHARLDRCGGVLPDDWPVLWKAGNPDIKALEEFL
ncbi:MAG: DUF1176 domain-containing protein [Pseudoxanthomonas sp.]